MPVLSMVSSKGGAGKTTAALLIAGEIASAGKRVVLIDADPNRPLEAWGNRPGKPDNIEVMVDESAETILDTIEEAKSRADFVIVDLEGRAADRIGFAVTVSDLVLIPTQGSTLDATEAAKSIKLIRQMSRVANREIRYAVFFTKKNAAIVEKTFRDIEAQFEKANVSLLPCSLIDRAAYRAIVSFGGTIRTIDPKKVSGLSGARNNAEDFVQAIIDTMRADKEGKARKAYAMPPAKKTLATGAKS